MLRPLASLLVVAALIFGIYENRRAFGPALFSMEFEILLVISGTTLASWMVNSLTHTIILRALNKKASLPLLFALHVGGGLLNYLPIRAGTAFRAHYLKHRLDLPYARFGSFLLVNTVLMFATASILGSLTVIAYYDLGTRESALLATVLAVLGVAGLGSLRLPAPPVDGASWWRRRFGDFVAGRNLILESRTVLAYLFLAHSILFILASLRLFGGFLSLQYDVTLSASLLLGAVSILALALALTPGGLGVTEFLIAAVSTLIGVPFSAGFTAAAIVRVVILALTTVVGIPCLMWLKRKSGNRQDDSADDPGRPEVTATTPYPPVGSDLDNTRSVE